MKDHILLSQNPRRATRRGSLTGALPLTGVVLNAPIVAVVENIDSVDILELAGATHVLPLKQQLGERLAHRVRAEHANVHVIGRGNVGYAVAALCKMRT